MSDLAKLLAESKTIAVVGLSNDVFRASHGVAAYMQEQGYRIIPVNPNETEVLGEKSYPDLLAVPVPVDIVDVFRRSEFVPDVMDQAIRIGAKALWMQEGVQHAEAAAKGRAAGLIVVENLCILREHRRISRR